MLAAVGSSRYADRSEARSYDTRYVTVAADDTLSGDVVCSGSDDGAGEADSRRSVVAEEGESLRGECCGARVWSGDCCAGRVVGSEYSYSDGCAAVRSTPSISASACAGALTEAVDSAATSAADADTHCSASDRGDVAGVGDGDAVESASYSIVTSRGEGEREAAAGSAVVCDGDNYAEVAAAVHVAAAAICGCVTVEEAVGEGDGAYVCSGESTSSSVCSAASEAECAVAGGAAAASAS